MEKAGDRRDICWESSSRAKHIFQVGKLLLHTPARQTKCAQVCWSFWSLARNARSGKFIPRCWGNKGLWDWIQDGEIYCRTEKKQINGSLFSLTSFFFFFFSSEASIGEIFGFYACVALRAGMLETEVFDTFAANYSASSQCPDNALVPDLEGPQCLRVSCNLVLGQTRDSPAQLTALCFEVETIY